MVARVVWVFVWVVMIWVGYNMVFVFWAVVIGGSIIWVS